MWFLSDPLDPNAVPDIEVFFIEAPHVFYDSDGESLEPGYYWWPCSPGGVPISDPVGPFKSVDSAKVNAQGPGR